MSDPKYRITRNDDGTFNLQYGNRVPCYYVQGIPHGIRLTWFKILGSPFLTLEEAKTRLAYLVYPFEPIYYDEQGKEIEYDPTTAKPLQGTLRRA